MKQFGWLAGLLLIQSQAFAQQATDTVKPLNPSPIGYETVQEAYEALREDPAATQSFAQGWTIFNLKVDGKYIIWSFTPENHPVHPSAVRREVVSRNGQISIAMSVLCHSSKLDCDQLVEQYEIINENLKRRLAGDASS